MNIIGLKAENFKKLKAVQIIPDQKSGTVILKGKNAQGKSSVLDAITAALTGKTFEEPIRDGQDHAIVVLDLDDIIITRKWTKKASYLEIKSKSGDKYATPQKLLDGMTNILSFDPSAIVTMRESEQIATLKKLTGLDTSAIDETIKTKYDLRTNVNREADYYKAQADGIVVSDPALPAEEISIENLTAKLEEINKFNNSVEDKKLEKQKIKNGIIRAETDISSTENLIDSYNADIEEYKAKIAELQSKIKSAEARKISTVDVVEELKKQEKEFVIPEKKSDADIVAEIKNINITNAKIRDAKKKTELETLQKQKEAESDKLTKEIEKAKRDKIDLVANTKMPIDGLYFDNDGIKYNNKPLASCSDAEKIKIGLSIALASNPKIKVILMKQGSFLDDESLTLVGEMAQKNGAQVWIEKVGTSGENGIIIEDGEIAPEF